MLERQQKTEIDQDEEQLVAFPCMQQQRNDLLRKTILKSNNLRILRQFTFLPEKVCGLTFEHFKLCLGTFG